MEPGKTSFFQALGVPTKIARGTIEITSDLKLVEANTKVGASEATLLNMLNISPFTYGMKIAQVYDGGQTFSPSVLDIKEEQLFAALNSAIKTITTISLAANYPTLPSVMHSMINGYKKALAVAVETDYSWEGIEELKDRIANPDAYASSAPAAGGAEAAAEEKAAEPEEKKEESEEESGDEGQYHRWSEMNWYANICHRFRWLVRLDLAAAFIVYDCIVIIDEIQPISPHPDLNVFVATGKSADHLKPLNLFQSRKSALQPKPPIFRNLTRNRAQESYP